MPEKIFIATPTHVCKRYCSEKFLRATVENAVDALGAVFHIACNSKGSGSAYYRRRGVVFTDMTFGNDYFGAADSIHKRITQTALFLRQQFLKTDCQWYLSLEADVVINSLTLPAMLSRNVPVLHSNCYEGFNTATVYSFTERLTMGCTLLKREVVEKVPFRYDRELLKAHYDALFAHDCVQNGIPMMYDPMIVVDHMEDHNGSRGWNQIDKKERQ